jgi:hypothetical protein
MQRLIQPSQKTRKLPPLILHPFADSSGPGKLLESSRASLMLQGLLPTGQVTQEELDKRLMDGRYCEIRMLFYVGKDLLRWIEQCMELVERDADLENTGIEVQSFAALLVDDPPKSVTEKLRKWGVVDYRVIFSRALGLNAVFARVPEKDELPTDFIRNYFRYADQMYECWKRLAKYSELQSEGFAFELYASGEYSRMLEREWESDLEG